MKSKLPIALFMLLLASCATDSYETGDGTLSYLRADFVEAYSNGNSQLYSAMTDDGDSLLFSNAIKAKWATTPDSVYRALLYYKKEDGKVSPITVSSVSVPNVRKTSELKDKVITDPVTWESSWLSKNNKYLNLGLILKTGNTEGVDAKQSIGMVCDTVVVSGSGAKMMHLRLYHNQNRVPEYYSATVYMSIPINRLPETLGEGDKIMLTVQTYDGVEERIYEL